MNDAYPYLVMNHCPIILPMVALVLLTFIVVSIIGLCLHHKKHQAKSYVHYLLSVFSVILLFFVQKTRASSGEIHHPEISGNISSMPYIISQK